MLDISCPLLPQHTEHAQKYVDLIIIHSRLFHGFRPRRFSGNQFLDAGDDLFHLDFLFQPAQHSFHFDHVDGFLDEKLHPGLVCTLHHLFITYFGNHDKVGPRCFFFDLRNQRHPVDASHQKIDQHNVRPDPDNLSDRGFRVGRTADDFPQIPYADDILQDLDHCNVVIDKIVSHLLSSISLLGKIRINSAPLPGAVTTSIVP